MKARNEIVTLIYNEALFQNCFRIQTQPSFEYFFGHKQSLDYCTKFQIGVKRFCHEIKICYSCAIFHGPAGDRKEMHL